MIRIEIIGPKGFWVAINVDKNTRIIKVLDEVCLIKQIGNSDNYDLKHGKKILDLSITVEMAMLYNSVTLELVKSLKPRHNCTVFIALQLSETNERLDVKAFNSETSLYDILKLYEQDCNLCLIHHSLNFQPVIQYLKEEYIGMYALQNCSLKNLGLFSGRVVLRHKFREIDRAMLQNIIEKIDREKKKIADIVSKNIVNLATDSDIFSQLTEPIEPLSKLEKLDYTNFEKKLPRKKNITEEPIPAYFENAQMSSNLLHTVNTEDVEMIHNVKYDSIPDNSFKDFKFPEETKGMHIYENYLSKESSEDIEPCDRDLHIYKMEEKSNLSPEYMNTQLPNNFFEHTENDLQIIYRDLKKNVEQLTEEPLMTVKLRNIESEKRLAKYQLAVVRVHFPDGYVVQANFKPLENTFQIYKLINSIIEEKYSDFELYTSPPKIILLKMTTLFNANLVPMSMVYFSGPKPATGFYLSSEARKELCSKEEADIASVNNISSSRSKILDAASNEIVIEPTTKKITDSSVMPKWFKGSTKRK